MGTAGEQSMVRNGHVYTANGLPTVNAYTAFSTHAHSLPTLTLPTLSLYPRSVSTHAQSLPTPSLYPRPVSTHARSLPTVSLYPRSAGGTSGILYPRSISTHGHVLMKIEVNGCTYIKMLSLSEPIF